MKMWGFFFGAVLLLAGSAGCSSTYFASSGYGGDDLYAIHDKTEIAQRKQAEAEQKKAEAEARRAEWEARLAEAEAAAAQNRYYSYRNAESENPYEAVLADTYQSAYARRLRGFESPTYRMPSSYYNFRYGNSFTYVSAYDPAFYNVMVMGDEVWVEPKYITAMFGTWGRPAVYADPWYYGWNWRPYYNWGFSFGSWGWGFGAWYDPWYYPAYGWNYGWGPFRPGHPHWGPGPGPSHRRYASNIVHRADPSAPPAGHRYSHFDSRSGSSGTVSGSSSWRRGTSTGVRNTSGSRPQNTNAAPSSSRNSGSNSSSRYGSGSGSSSYRSNSGGNTYNRGGSSSSGSSYRSSSSGSSGSSYRGGSSGSSSSGSRSSGGASRNAGGR